MVEINATNAAEAAQKVKAGELPGPARSLAEAVCRVMQQVGYVQKDKTMEGVGRYRYASIEAVIDALRPEMIRQQLVLLPVGLKPLTLEVFEGRNGGRQNRTQVEYTFKLLHAPTGQSEPVVVIGEAIDVGDKSSNKAMTAARKYALIMAFNIETGTDPDDTPSQDQERAAKAELAPSYGRTAHPAAPPKAAPTMPADGKELHNRLSSYDAKLVKAGLIAAGRLLQHVRRKGAEAGYPRDIADWSGPAIPFAVEVVKEFEADVRRSARKPATA